MEENDKNGDEHERYYFRILRPDEDIKHLRAKDSSKKPPHDEKEKKQSVEEHIGSGSQSGYKSPWISLTAELDVALAFAGVISRVAFISSSDLEKERQKSEIVHLDKEYLRKFLSQQDAVARSRRSDEVLVFKEITCAVRLAVNIRETADRILHPDFKDEDENIFPVLKPSTSIESTEMIAGSNKRLFRLDIDGKNWICTLPRPNYDLDSPVLFDNDLVRLCQHQFTTLCAYRSLNAPVPKCALYIFRLSVDEKLRPGTYQSAFILMEDMKQCSEPEAGLKVAQAMYPADLLLGNWDPVEGAADSTNLVSKGTGAFFINNEDNVVRMCVDRALGCIYPEDRTKLDKIITEFQSENVRKLKKSLENNYTWCYGSIGDKRVLQMIMEVVGNNKRLKNLKQVLKMSTGLPWNKENSEDLCYIVEKRMEDLLAIIPYHEVGISSTEKPIGRDGHGAISFQKYGAMKMMICGGNSEDGPLNDFWEFDLASKMWTRLSDMPCSGRYSFSMHLFFERYIIIYGGCSKNSKSQMVSRGDAFIYDIEKYTWSEYVPSKLTPAGRCRHGSYLVNIDEHHAEMFVLGGSDKKGERRDDVWKLDIRRTKGNFSFKWTEMKKMKQKTHRCFLFAHQRSYYLLGGFGRNLRNLEEVDVGKDPRKSNVVTRSYRLHLPASESESFMDSKSLAGFGAAYDELEERVFLIGGGNINVSNSRHVNGKTKNAAFGVMPNNREILSKPRILILNHADGEWMWKAKHPYDLLDDEYKLPNLLHWSAVYMDHSVVLFGGRNHSRI